MASERRHCALPRISPQGRPLRVSRAAPTAAPRSRTVDLGGKVTTLVPEGIRGQGLAWSPSARRGLVRRPRRTRPVRPERRRPRRPRADRSPARRSALIVHDISRDGRILVERYGSQPGIFGLAPGQTRERDLSWFDGSHPVGLSDDGLDDPDQRDRGRGRPGRAPTTCARPTARRPSSSGEGEALDLSADGKWVLARRPTPRRISCCSRPAPARRSRSRSPPSRAWRDATFFPDGEALSCWRGGAGQEASAVRPGPPLGQASPDHRSRLRLRQPRVVSPTAAGSPRTATGARTCSCCRSRAATRARFPNSKDLDLLRWTPDGKSSLRRSVRKHPGA